jgi:hypothetical protein
VLAGGLGQIECVGQSFPRRRVRRFGRAMHLIDRAEEARRAAKTRRLLGRTAKSLGKLNGGVTRDGEGGRLSAACVTGLEAMLTDAQHRAEDLALGF